MTTQPPRPSVMTSPADEDLTFFSANDRRIDPSDPIFKTVPPVGVVPQPKPHPLPDSRPTDLSVLSALRANSGPMGGGFPVNMVPSEGSNLYSFTLPSTRSHPPKPPSVTESFGVLSSQVSRSGTASPRYAHSTTPSVVSDTEHHTHSTTPSVVSDTEHSDYKEHHTHSAHSSDTEHRTIPHQEHLPSHTSHAHSPTHHDDDHVETVITTHSSRDVTPTPIEQVLTQQKHPSGSQAMPHSPSSREVELPPRSPSPREAEFPPHSPSPKEAELPPHRPSRLDSDIETSSVVSVQQLTDAYLNDPFDSAEEKLTAGASNTVIPVALPAEVGSNRKVHPPTPVENRTHSWSKPTQVQTEFAKLPSHIQSSPVVPSKKWGQGSPPLDKRSPSTSSTPHPSPLLPSKFTSQDPQSSGGSQTSLPEVEMEQLREQLSKALQSKANLEGQLQSVVNECKTTLKDRASLQSKLGHAEAEIAELIAALEEEKRKNARPDPEKIPQSPSDDSGEVEQVREALEETKTTLESERKEAAALKSELAREKHNSKQLENELCDSQTAANELKEALLASKEKVRDLNTELDKKKNELDEEQCKSSSLEASYGALEETKAWLHQQLQESLEAKMRLQEELREAKANGIAHCIKAEQLLKENAAFQDQIGELQRGVLQDKARLVSELEAIEADVLSREDSYGHVVAEKGQLEEVIKMKNDMIDKLNSELARTRVAKEEGDEKVEDLEMKNDDLTHQVKDLGRNKKSLEDKLNTVGKELESIMSDLAETERSKVTLQERLREAEAALVGKDGTMQGLNDAREILRQELEMTREGRNTLEKELDAAKMEVAKLEDELKAAVDKNREKDAILRAATQNQQTMAAEKEGLAVQLREKDRLLEEKVEELQALESQSGELLDHFKNLQDQFQTIATRSGDVQDSVAEKDRVISHLASEKDNMEDELSSLRDSKDLLERRVAQLQQEKAHLEGKIDTSPSKGLEEFQKLLQDKSQLQGELNSLKLSHQGDLIKAQAKNERLESELRAAKRDKEHALREKEEAVRQMEEEVARLDGENAQLKSDLRNAMSKVDKPVRGGGGSPQLLRQLERERDRLKAKADHLVRDNKELSQQLEQETAQRTEIERAGSIVARNLKQNAQENERKLQAEIQDLTLQLEKLRGQLAGMELTQSAMREHTGGLEVALAKREAALLKLSAQAQRVLEEKELEDKSVVERIGKLQRQLQDSKKALHVSKDKEKEERRKVGELSAELLNKESEMTELKHSLDQLSKTVSDSDTLEDRVTELATQKEKLESELAKTQSLLHRTKTAADSVTRELSDREAQVGILTKELSIARLRASQLDEELKRSRGQLKAVRQEHSVEMESLRQTLSEGTRESSVMEGGAGGRGLFEASISTIGVDDTDLPGHTSQDRHDERDGCRGDSEQQGSQKKVSELNSLYRAQLAEMGSRLELARKQGQKVAEIRKSGEISALQEQLGSKSKTIHGLRSCLVSLKEDMGKLSVEMDRHSTSLHAANASTRQIENQIENLKRSSAVPSPLYLSTSTNHSE